VRCPAQGLRRTVQIAAMSVISIVSRNGTIPRTIVRQAADAGK
jgi:hypothetical protein